MPRTHLPTHITADQPSPYSGVVYTQKCLDDLVSKMGVAPVYCGKMNDNRFVYSEPLPFAKLVGFDVIDNKLYVIIETETENDIEKLMEHDYVVRFMAEFPEGGSTSKIVDNIISIRSLLLEAI